MMTIAAHGLNEQINEENLLSEFLRLLVLLWPNNKQIRHWGKGSIIAGL